MKKLIIIQGHDRAGKTTLALGLETVLSQQGIKSLVISRHNRNRYYIDGDTKYLRGIDATLIVDGIENIYEKQFMLENMGNLFSRMDNTIMFDVFNNHMLEIYKKSKVKPMVTGISIMGLPLENVQDSNVTEDNRHTLPFVKAALSYIME